MDVELVDSMGDDLSVVNAARVSFGQRGDELKDADKGLIRFLMKNKHASPFEHCSLSFAIETTIAVSREAMRHRTFSFNEFSTRYSKISEDYNDWYVPDAAHMRTQKGKPGAYHFEPITDPGVIASAQQAMSAAYQASFETYRLLVEQGVAREVARNVLPLGMTTKFYMSGNLRNWFNFLVLRNADQALMEIRDVAALIESHVEAKFPECYRAWVEAGRIQI